MARISNKELNEWMAYYSIEPFGSDTQYTGPAIVAQTVFNRQRNKGEQAAKLEQFIPTFKKKRQSVDEMLQVAQMLTIGLGGQDLRPETEQPEEDAEPEGGPT